MDGKTALVEAAFGTELPNDITAAIAESALNSIAEWAEGPPAQRESGIFAMELIVASRSSNVGFSVSPRNLLGLAPISPRFINDGFKASLAATSAATIASAGAFTAFMAAVTVLALRTVGRDEAMILHMAHRIARADGTFTLADMVAAGPQLQSEYDVVKVSADDLRAHLENLERSKSLSPTTTGYRLSERIWLIGLDG